MIGFRFLTCTVAGLAIFASVISAHPVALPRPNAFPCPLGSEELHRRHSKRQEGGSGLSDLDILQFALTLEHLEAAFYKEGFAKFPASDFEALGFSAETIAGLQAVGETEAIHVTQLMAAITAQGVTPVPPCTYNFNTPDAATMVATAKVLEAVGVSAYLGAAPLVTGKAVLSAAASIVTVESRHQTFIRTIAGDSPVPQAFDVAVGARQIFTLAAAFITECPPEANLNIQAFPSLVITNAATTKAGSILTLAQQDAITADGATFCAFASGASGIQFAPVENGGCTVPSGMAGEVFVTLTNDGASNADENVIAGPAVITLS
ncbi:ferritin-like domain-containing protein [Kalaharituber pfeilii]|nr:ferritin-like domain-containing protein [Kalaharituber pfeilii]